MEALSRWVETGYQSLGSRLEGSTNNCSWRFWARGAKKDAILCGLLKSSSDKIGRAYPFLLIGTGPIDGFESHWDLVPFACEKTWREMEYVAAKRLADFAELERQIGAFRPPVGDWGALNRDREAAREVDYSGADRDVAAIGGKETVMIPLSDMRGRDIYTLAGLWHLWLKENGGRPPHAVFIGGSVDKASLAVFRRALTPDDFAKLWTQSNKETML